MGEMARALGRTVDGAVLLKGGHLPEAHATDVLWDGRDLVEIPGPRIDTTHTHGTGCTLSSAIAARLALGDGLLPAVRAAKAYLEGALRHADALRVGSGHGPVHHFHAVWAAARAPLRS
jgi:hydroxymethylpyrimidine/phosphomethylpyrimidine kinase